MNSPVPIKADLVFTFTSPGQIKEFKVIAQLFYRALCLGNRFQLSGHWGTELFWAGSGTTLCGTRRFPPAWVALSSSAASPSTSGTLRSAQCSKSAWHCGTMQGVWDEAGGCKMLCQREQRTRHSRREVALQGQMRIHPQTHFCSGCWDPSACSYLWYRLIQSGF